MPDLNATSSPLSEERVREYEQMAREVEAEMDSTVWNAERSLEQAMTNANNLGAEHREKIKALVAAIPVFAADRAALTARLEAVAELLTRADSLLSEVAHRYRNTPAPDEVHRDMLRTSADLREAARALSRS